MKKYYKLQESFKKEKKKILEYQNNKKDKIENKDKNNFKIREILGDYMPYGEYKAGEYSYPGPDVTFSPIPSNAMLVSLGCMDNQGSSDNSSLIWPKTQIPANFGTGSGSNYLNINQGNLRLNPINWLDFLIPEFRDPRYENFTFPNITQASNSNTEPIGQPSTNNVPIPIRDTLPIIETENGLTYSEDVYPVSNMLEPGGNNSISTPFHSTVVLNTDNSVLSLPAVASNYAVANLSQEGMLWTLWPLAKPKKEKPLDRKDTYFNGFNFGTAMTSKYRIGQMGYFYTNVSQGCIPMGADLSSFSPISGNLNNQILGQVGTYNTLAPNNQQSTQQMNAGIQGFYRTLLISTDQLLAIVVVKVTEQIARVYNPAAGIMAEERFIYVGYDGWSVIRTSANPVGPMMAQVHVSPQNVTGSVVKENYQVIFPPNFYNQIYYKNDQRTVPVNTRAGLSGNNYLSHAGTTNDRLNGDFSDFIIELARENPALRNIPNLFNLRNDPRTNIEVLETLARTYRVNTSLGADIAVTDFNGAAPFNRRSNGVNGEDSAPEIPENTLIPDFILNFNNIDNPVVAETPTLVSSPIFSDSLRPYVNALIESNNAGESNSVSENNNNAGESNINNNTNNETNT